MNEITDFLQKRRSVTVPRMVDIDVPEEDISTILHCAMRVPDHGALNPWKICVISGDARPRLGQTVLRPEFAEAHDDASEDSLIFEENRFLRTSVIMAVLSTPKPHPKIPVWEMELSAGAVCMNIVTAAQSLDYAAQWVTEWYSYNDKMLAALGGNTDTDRIAGFIYIGGKTEAPKERRRPEAQDVLHFISS